MRWRFGGGELPSAGAAGACVEAIERKLLFHFHPGTAILALEDVQSAAPEVVARAARSLGVKSVAFALSGELDCALALARECRELGVATVGRATQAVSSEAMAAWDAVSLEVVPGIRLDRALDAARLSATWVEVSVFVTPEGNDIERLVDKLGPDVPIHLGGHHPSLPIAMPLSALRDVRDRARLAGARYVYVAGGLLEGTTACPGCGAAVIERRAGRLETFGLRAGACMACGCEIPGRLEGEPASWGERRVPIDFRVHGPV